jgi:bacterial/archaeal transporter family protein
MLFLEEMELSIGLMAGLIAMLCWGIGDFLQAIPIRKLGTLKTMFFAHILVLGVSIVFLLVYMLNNGVILMDTMNFALLAIGGVINVAALYFFFRSFEIGEVSIVAPISATYSLITVFLAFVFLGERLTFLKYFAIFVIVCGIVFTSGDIRKLKHFHTAKGVKEAFITLLLWGVYFFILGIVSNNISALNSSGSLNYHVAANLFIFSGLINAVLLVGYSALRGGIVSLKELKAKNILLIFLINLGLFNLAWFAISYGIAQDLVSFVTPVSSLYPAVTVVLAVIFFKEKLAKSQKLGILAILLGILLISI